VSSGISVYAVDVERLKAVLGAVNQPLVDALYAEQEGFLDSIDAIDEDAPVYCIEAVVHLLNDEPDEDVPGYLYGYALQAICAHIGEELPDVGDIVGASDWIEEVDAALKKKRVPIRLSDLVYGGSPVPIPEPDDYPFIGHWPADKLPAALAALRQADPADLDDETAEAFKRIGEWLEAAARTQGASLIGFLS
jgi:hypothetical protein